MNTPITSCPASFSSHAATLESTPPDMAKTMRDMGTIHAYETCKNHTLWPLQNVITLRSLEKPDGTRHEIQNKHECLMRK